MDKTLKIYYSPKMSNLLKVADSVMFFLPEQMTNKPAASTLYQLGNTIATMNITVLDAIKERIINNLLPSEKVLFIHLFDQQQKICTFHNDGTIKQFYMFQI